MKPLYEERGGGRIGYSFILSWHASYPLSRIQIFNDRLTLKVWPWTSTVFFYDINVIDQTWPMINIEHHGSAKKYLSFSSLNSKKLISEMKKYMVNVNFKP